MTLPVLHDDLCMHLPASQVLRTLAPGSNRDYRATFDVGWPSPDVCSRLAPDLVQPCYFVPTALPMQVGTAKGRVRVHAPLLFRVFFRFHCDVTCLPDLPVGALNFVHPADPKQHFDTYACFSAFHHESTCLP
jgi:hypothetical protein